MAFERPLTAFKGPFKGFFKAFKTPLNNHQQDFQRFSVTSCFTTVDFSLLLDFIAPCIEENPQNFVAQFAATEKDWRTTP